MTWVECPADVVAEGVECGTLAVPLDYRKPDGRRIEVMISRLAGRNPEKRRGILLTNPGGPSAGLTFPAQLRAGGLPQSVRDAYDVIGVDPHTTDRVVLDSSHAEGGWDVEGARLHARGMEDTFPDFAKWLAARPDHGLGSTPEQVRAKYFDLAARLDEAPAQTITGPQFRGLTWFLLYGSGDVPFATPAALWKALDTDTPLPPLGSTPNPAFENLISSRFSVICADSRRPTSVETYERNVAADRVSHPMFGAAAANVYPCAFWPDPVEQPVRISDRGPRNVLVVQNERDPATPLAGARSMRRALGDRAALLTVDQGGHGVYVYGANTCANDRTTEYLLGGHRPAHDLRCAAEARTSAPAPVPVIG